MPLYQVVILAIVQSVTEFLPISSTAHLALVPRLLGWDNPAINSLDFDIALHIGTLAAIFIYFYRDWVQLFASGFGLPYKNGSDVGRNPRLLWFLAIATVPVAVLGYIFKDQAEGPWRSSYVIGGMLIGVGILMYFAEKAGRCKKDLKAISLLDSLAIGAAQAVAIIPGTSRSGITISAALFRNMDHHSAARFSFLLSTPALGGASLKALLDMYQSGGLSPDMHVPFVVGILVSAISGWIVIAFFLRFLRNHGLRLFIYYRIGFGIIVIALAILFRQTAG